MSRCLIYLCRNYQALILEKNVEAFMFAQEGKAQIEAGLTVMKQVQKGA